MDQIVVDGRRGARQRAVMKQSDRLADDAGAEIRARGSGYVHAIAECEAGVRWGRDIDGCISILNKKGSFTGEEESDCSVKDDWQMMICLLIGESVNGAQTSERSGACRPRCRDATENDRQC